MLLLWRAPCEADRNIARASGHACGDIWRAGVMRGSDTRGGGDAKEAEEYGASFFCCCCCCC